MDEASKTKKIRGQEFMEKYFSGKVLDFGCGTSGLSLNAVAKIQVVVQKTGDKIDIS